MKNWDVLPSKEIVEKTAAALKANGFETFIVESAAKAKEKALELIPAGSEVFTMASITVDSIGLSAALNETKNYDSVRSRLGSMDPKSNGREMRKLGAGPDVAVGSVHAVTETGTMLIASLTGSQIPAYAYGAQTVVYIVSAKKIVPTLDDAWKRLYEHVVPQESGRARKAYGLPETFNSFPSKVLVFNREVQPGRVKVIIVNEDLGF
jgi:hypothetical protein